MHEDLSAPGGVTKKANTLELIQDLQQKLVKTDALLTVAMDLIKQMRIDIGELHKDQNRLISVVQKHDRLLKR